MLNPVLRNLFFVASLLFATSCWASQTSGAQQKDYFIKLSVDNHINYSQTAVGDLAFSAISGLAYLADGYNANDNLLYRIGFGYAVFFVSLINHEVSGHGFRAIEMGGKIDEISLSPFAGRASYWPPKNYHIQKNAIISLGGNETNYLLSQKIANSMLEHKQQIDPIAGCGYIFSGGNQLFYIYMTDKKLKGHDLAAYARDMKIMYGDKAMSLNKIKAIGFLDILDPIMLASIYSAATGNHTDIPALPITDNISISPFARLIIAPYGTLEKKFGAYIFTEYTPVKIGFSYGTQSKTDTVVTPTSGDIGKYLYLKQAGYITSPASAGVFTGLQPQESVKKITSYSVDVSVFNLFTVDQFKVGADGVFWRQPELLVQDAYRAKAKTGWLLALNTTYQLNDRIGILGRVGYKTKGFVPGHYIHKTPLVSLALEWKL